VCADSGLEESYTLFVEGHRCVSMNTIAKALDQMELDNTVPLQYSQVPSN